MNITEQINEAIHENDFEQIKHIVTLESLVDKKRKFLKIIQKGSDQERYIQSVPKLSSISHQDSDDYISKNMTILGNAIMHGNIEIVKHLIEVGKANVNENNSISLAIAAKSGRLDIVKCLASHGVLYHNNNAIFYAIDNDYIDVMNFLINVGVDIEKRVNGSNFVETLFAKNKFTVIKHFATSNDWRNSNSPREIFRKYIYRCGTRDLITNIYPQNGLNYRNIYLDECHNAIDTDNVSSFSYLVNSDSLLSTCDELFEMHKKKYLNATDDRSIRREFAAKFDICFEKIINYAIENNKTNIIKYVIESRAYDEKNVSYNSAIQKLYTNCEFEYLFEYLKNKNIFYKTKVCVTKIRNTMLIHALFASNNYYDINILTTNDKF